MATLSGMPGKIEANTAKGPLQQPIITCEFDGDSKKSNSTTIHPAEKQTGRWFHWHEPDTSAEEKRLIFKLDWFLLSYCCLCFFIKWLDGNNVTNA